MVELTGKGYIIITKSRGIIKPQNMTTQELINTLTRYDSRSKVKNNCKKLLEIGLEKIAEIQNISKNRLNQAKKLQKEMNELKEIARLKRIKNVEKLMKEELNITLLKSEYSAAECTFEKILIIIQMMMMILMMIK